MSFFWILLQTLEEIIEKSDCICLHISPWDIRCFGVQKFSPEHCTYPFSEIKCCFDINLTIKKTVIGTLCTPYNCSLMEIKNQSASKMTTFYSSSYFLKKKPSGFLCYLMQDNILFVFRFNIFFSPSCHKLILYAVILSLNIRSRKRVCMYLMKWAQLFSFDWCISRGAN